MMISLTRSIRLLRASGTVLSLLGLSACLGSKADICGQQLPRFDSQLAGALLELSPGRGLASEGSGDGVAQVEFNQAYWLRWAEDRLVEAQAYLDHADDAKDLAELRRELSDMATAFVSVHGYARMGKADRMAKVIRSIQARSARVRALACPGEATAMVDAGGG